MSVCQCIKDMAPKGADVQAGSKPALHVQFLKGSQVAGGIAPEALRGDATFVALKGCQCLPPVWEV